MWYTWMCTNVAYICSALNNWNHVLTFGKITFFLFFFLCGLSGGLKSEHKGRFLPAPQALSTFYREGEVANFRGKIHHSSPRVHMLEGRYDEPGEYPKIFWTYATPKIEIRTLQTRFYAAPRRNQRL